MKTRHVLAAWLAAALLAAPLAGCNRQEAPAAAGDDFAAVRDAILEENRDLLGGLPPEQREADFDALWSLIRTSYPFAGVAGRAGIDMEALYAQYKVGLKNTTGDIAFINLLDNMVAEFGGIGHFDFFITSGEYTALRDTYTALKDTDPHFAYLDAVLADPATAAAYEKLAAVEKQVLDAYAAHSAAASPAAPSVESTSPPAEMPPSPANLTLRFYEDVSAAYVHVAQMLGEAEAGGDRDALLAFFEQAARYDNLIIDITGNGGGSDFYWMNNLVAPLLTEPLGAEALMLFPRTVYTEGYLDTVASTADMRPIEGSLAELSGLPNLSVKDLAGMDAYTLSSLHIEPTGERPYSGNIWLLVDKAVYSASETFAMFCQGSGFARVVGRPTGGDGAGVDPMLFRLPHSGLVGRFSVFYTLNADGGSNEEYGTLPDVLCEADETPLTACLAAIQRLQEPRPIPVRPTLVPPVSAPAEVAPPRPPAYDFEGSTVEELPIDFAQPTLLYSYDPVNLTYSLMPSPNISAATRAVYALILAPLIHSEEAPTSSSDYEGGFMSVAQDGSYNKTQFLLRSGVYEVNGVPCDLSDSAYAELLAHSDSANAAGPRLPEFAVYMNPLRVTQAIWFEDATRHFVIDEMLEATASNLMMLRVNSGQAIDLATGENGGPVGPIPIEEGFTAIYTFDNGVAYHVHISGSTLRVQSSDMPYECRYEADPEVLQGYIDHTVNINTPKPNPD